MIPSSEAVVTLNLKTSLRTLHVIGVTLASVTSLST